MTTEWGMNLAGVERVFELEDQLDRMQRKVSMLERRAEQLQEEIARLEEKRDSVKAEIVRYEAAPGTSLIPIRRSKRRSARTRVGGRRVRVPAQVAVAELARCARGRRP